MDLSEAEREVAYRLPDLPPGRTASDIPGIRVLPAALNHALKRRLAHRFRASALN